MCLSRSRQRGEERTEASPWNGEAQTTSIESVWRGSMGENCEIISRLVISVLKVIAGEANISSR